MAKTLLVCYANGDTGLGHLSRLITLAEWLRRDDRVTTEILIFGDFFAKYGISNFKIHLFSTVDNFITSVEKVICKDNFSAVVFDIPSSQKLSGLENFFGNLKTKNTRLIAIDSMLEFCNFFDLVWIPSFNFKTSEHRKCKCPIKYGWDSYIIPARVQFEEWSAGKKLLVLTGGSDPTKLCRSLPAYLDKTLGDDIEIHWVQGPFSDPPDLSNIKGSNWTTHLSPPRLDDLILKSNYILTVYGVSFFEALQYGVPTVVFSPYGSKDDAELLALSRQRVASVADGAFDAVDSLIHLIADDDLSRRYSQNSLRKLIQHHLDLKQKIS